MRWGAENVTICEVVGGCIFQPWRPGCCGGCSAWRAHESNPDRLCRYVRNPTPDYCNNHPSHEPEDRSEEADFSSLLSEQKACHGILSSFRVTRQITIKTITYFVSTSSWEESSESSNEPEIPSNWRHLPLQSILRTGELLDANGRISVSDTYLVRQLQLTEASNLVRVGFILL